MGDDRLPHLGCTVAVACHVYTLPVFIVTGYTLPELEVAEFTLQ